MLEIRNNCSNIWPTIKLLNDYNLVILSLKDFPVHFLWGSPKIQLLLWPFPKLVGSANCTCLFFTSLQLLIAWLDQIMFYFRKNPLFRFSHFYDPAQDVHALHSLTHTRTHVRARTHTHTHTHTTHAHTQTHHKVFHRTTTIICKSNFEDKNFSHKNV